MGLTTMTIFDVTKHYAAKKARKKQILILKGRLYQINILLLQCTHDKDRLEMRIAATKSAK